MESSSNREVDHVRTSVVRVCEAVGARAAGYWELDLENHRLVQIAFVSGAGLAPDLGREFEAATRTASLNQKDLGIVAAALSGQPAISRVDELPPDSGSGRWLRVFGASRSVAVPARDVHNTVRGVLSVALPRDIRTDDREIAEQLERAWSDFNSRRGENPNRDLALEG